MMGTTKLKDNIPLNRELILSLGC